MARHGRYVETSRSESTYTRRRHTTRTTPRHIKQIAPSVPSGPAESDAAFARRLRQGSYVEEGMRRERRKKRMVLAAVVVVALCIALAVGIFVYFKTTDTNLSLADSTAASSLVAQTPDEPYYVLCSADLRDPAYATSRPEDIASVLVRVDESARALTLLTIPAVVELTFPNGEAHTLADAYDQYSDGDIVTAIAGFAGVGISHYLTTDAASIADLAEALGGVNMNLTQEVDDPVAGHIVLYAGDVTLDGPSAEVLVRATNLSGGFEAAASNRVAFTWSLISQALGEEGLGFASVVSDVSRFIDTDYSTSDLMSIAEILRPLETVTLYECTVPYTATRSASGEVYSYRVSEAEWASILEAFQNGDDPNQALAVNSVVASEVSVEVRNGTSINGAAASLGQMLSQLGYNVIGTGNTNDATTYPETLIIYTDPAYAEAAKAIVSQAGIGRVVNGGDFYSSEANVIAIIGTDWAG